VLLDELESQSIYISREAFNKFERLTMLWSNGSDLTVLLTLARKAFFGHAFPTEACGNYLQDPQHKACPVAFGGLGCLRFP
jgi:sulfate adenylyltransferase subunit 2